VRGGEQLVADAFERGRRAWKPSDLSPFAGGVARIPDGTLEVDGEKAEFWGPADKSSGVQNGVQSEGKWTRLKTTQTAL
jgi:hypothetical protein